MPGQRGEAKVTLSRIAEEVGVSVATVSNTYNGTGRVSDQLRQRILRVGAELGFGGASPLARGLRRGHAGAVGWILTESLSYAVENEATLLFLRGMNEVLETATVGLLVISSPGVAAPDTSIARNAIVDGFIAYALADDDPMLHAAQSRGERLVVVEQPILHEVPSVLVNGYSGCRTAARHLLGLGHREFGILSLRTSRTSVEGPLPDGGRTEITYDMTRQRLSGYLDQLAEAGIDPEQVPCYEAASTLDSARRGAQWLLTRHPRPTAVLAMSDTLALGIVQAAQDQGLGVPGNVSVVGFDDTPSAAQAAPQLTTVRQPLREKGQRAARLFLEAAAESVTLETELIVRESTGPAPRTSI